MLRSILLAYQPPDNSTFSQNKIATNQYYLLFCQNKSALTTNQTNKANGVGLDVILNSELFPPFFHQLLC